MSDFWVEIPASRLVESVFVPAETAIDLEARGLGLMESAFDHAIDDETSSDSGEWEDWFPIYFSFPDAWSLDLSWGNLYLRARILLSLQASGGSLDTHDVRFTQYGVGVSTYGHVKLTADIPLAAPPTGLVAYNVQRTVVPADVGILVASRAPGTMGLSSWKLVTL